MPLGLWKSRWEISREEWQAESRDLRTRSDEVREECRDLRADHDGETRESRLFDRELLIRLEKTYAGVGKSLELLGERVLFMGERIVVLGERIDAMAERIDANTEAVRDQTEAIFRLIDRFEDADGSPPV
ncbi:MAG TPA: hypothetical protein VMH33_10760 [Solirubrobacterales bacterium]|nr:hypothetical protein [Solirubrobacterales bacterium]